MWTMPGFKLLAEHGGATRVGANGNVDPFAQRDRHAQTTRQERQKKAATRGVGRLQVRLPGVLR